MFVFLDLCVNMFKGECEVVFVILVEVGIEGVVVLLLLVGICLVGKLVLNKFDIFINGMVEV